MVKRFLHVRDDDSQWVELKTKGSLREVLVADSHSTITGVLEHVDGCSLVVDLRREDLQDVLGGGVGGENGEVLPVQDVHSLDDLRRNQLPFEGSQLVPEGQIVHLR